MRDQQAAESSANPSTFDTDRRRRPSEGFSGVEPQGPIDTTFWSSRRGRALVINRGSEAAWSTRRLLETAWAREYYRFNEEITRASDYWGDVLRNLVIVLGGVVTAIGSLNEQSYEEMLPYLWSQLAVRSDSEEAVLMREMVTAWSSGNPEDVDALNASGTFDKVDGRLLVTHFAYATELLIKTLSKQSGRSADDCVQDLWTWLDTAAS